MSLPPPPAAEPVMFPPAELDRRFSAFVIDRSITWGVAAAVGYAVWQLADTDVLVALLSAVGCAFVLGLAGAVLLGTTGLTPGKAAVGLRVVRRPNGRPIGVLPALGRAAVLGVAGVPTIGMGLATLAWTAAMDPSRQRLGLHDRIGEAIVIDVRPMPSEVDDDEQRPQQIVNLTAMRLMPVPALDPANPPVPIPTPVPNRPAEPTPPQPSQPPPTQPPPALRPPVTGPPPAGTPTPGPVPAPTAAPAPAGRAPGAHRAEPTPALPTGQPTSPSTGEQTRARPGAGTPPPPAAPPPTAPSAVQWRVAFDTGEAFVVEGLAVVGRRPEPRSDEPVRHVVPLRSSDMSLSKTHAQFQVAPDGALVVMDRGSTNGSYVIRRGLSKALTAGRPSTLLPGDEVRFGDRTMTVERV